MADCIPNNLFQQKDFADLYSLTYHLYPPTRVLKIDDPISVKPQIALEDNMQHRSFKGFSS